MTIITRTAKGAPLTYVEMDANLTELAAGLTRIPEDVSFPAAPSAEVVAYQSWATSADAVIQANVTSEAATRLAADAAVTSAFQAADSALDTRLDAVETGQSSAVVGYDTQANLFANLTPADKSVAYVTNDATPSKNGTYRKSGASGAGSWVQSSYDRVALVEGQVNTSAIAWVSDGATSSFYPLKLSASDTVLRRTNWEGTYDLTTTPRTNYVRNSTFSSDFAGTGVAPVITPGVGTAPDGVSTATRIQLNKGAGTTTGDRARAFLLFAASHANVAGRIWARARTGTPAVLFTIGSAPGTAAVLGSSWVEVYPQARTLSVDGLYITLRGGFGTSDTADIEVSAGQVTPATVAADFSPSTAAMVGPYIPTTTAEVTAADYTVSGSKVTLPYTPAAGASYWWVPTSLAPATGIPQSSVVGLDTNVARITAIETKSFPDQAQKHHFNPVKNPLFLTDAVGYTGVPSGYYGVGYGGAGAYLASSRIVTKGTPLYTDQCLEIDCAKTATTHSDHQLQFIVDIPLYLQGSAQTLNLLYYLNRDNVGSVTGLPFCYHLNAAGGVIGSGFYASAKTADPSVNTWGAVLVTVPVTDTSAKKMQISIRTSGDIAAPDFTGKAWISGVVVDWNRTNLSQYEFGASQQAKEIAEAVVAKAGISTPLTSVNTSDQWSDSRGNVEPILPSQTIVCWGDSLTAATYPSSLAGKFSPARTVTNCGIGGETSSQILARVKGHDWDGGTGIVWTPGTIRLKTLRTVPPRLIDGAYTASWTTYGATIAEPRYVEFFNDGALIGTSWDQLKAACSISGTRLTAAGHPFANGDQVYFLSSTASGMYVGKNYYVRDSDAGGFSLSETSGGSAVSFGVGTATALGGFYFDWTYGGGTHNITTVSHTGFDTKTLALWMGANNISSPSQIKADIAAAFAHAKAMAKRVVVLTIIPNSAWTLGTTESNNMLAVNAWIKNAFPNNYADAYGYLLTKGDGGTNDNADIAAGITPRSLRIDAIHLTSTGYGHIADLVASAMSGKGW